MTIDALPPPSDGQFPVATSSSTATGKQLLGACWGLLRQDRELLWLPLIATVAGVIAALILFVPGFAVGWLVGGSQHHSWGGWVGGVCAVFAASVVSIYFQAALVIGANERADGGDPTVRGVLRQTWAHREKILSWAAVSTTVGLAIRTLERRLGILGTLLGFLGGVAWAIASFLVVPIVIAEDLGPIEAVKRSAQLVRSTWGTSVRTTLRLGFGYALLALVPFAVILVGLGLALTASDAAIAVGVLLIVAGVGAAIALSMVVTAILTYARALIYRYATGQPVPGIDPALFAGVFRQKGSRRRFA